MLVEGFQSLCHITGILESHTRAQSCVHSGGCVHVRGRLEESLSSLFGWPWGYV